MYQYFRGTFCLHLQGRRWRKQNHPEHWHKVKTEQNYKQGKTNTEKRMMWHSYTLHNASYIIISSPLFIAS
jgi:hypothetical protein